MTSLSLYFKGWLLALPILILAAGTVAAQHVVSDGVAEPVIRSFSIENGAVFIDGREIPSEKLPKDFPPKGVSRYHASATFSSDENLIIQLQDGRRYVLEGDSLWLKTPTGDFDCILRVGGCTDIEENASILFVVTAPPETILERKAGDLREQARRLQDLQGRLAESQTNELKQMLEEMAMHAAEAARTASAFPHIQMQHYLSDIQDNNKGLFDRLMSERLMEHETVSMARKVAAMEEGRARRDSIAVLRERLTEIFELKQENRRREVEQLEEKLQELQKAVSERERLGDQIVDRRLQELLGNDTLDW